MPLHLLSGQRAGLQDVRSIRSGSSIIVQRSSEYSKLEKSLALRGPAQRDFAGPAAAPGELKGSHFMLLCIGSQESGL